MKQLAIWTIRRALQDRQQLDVQRYGNLVVSVNISPNQINEEGFLAQLKGMLEEFRIRPELLRLFERDPRAALSLLYCAWS